MGSATKNKWLKYLYLKNYSLLGPYVSETKKMSRESLWSLLGKYGHVIVKPVWGSRGKGVIQVSDLGSDKYAIHYENKQSEKKGKEKTYSYIKEKMGSADYMVQQRINRPTIDQCPFDMRVIVQRRTNSSRWVVTGKVIKVAGKGYIVSNNSRSKGKLYMFNKGIKKSSISHLSVSKLESEIDRIAILSAVRLRTFFPDHRIYGLDIATDRQGHVFIIESNLYPSMSHFEKLKDRSMYYRIKSYKKG